MNHAFLNSDFCFGHLNENAFHSLNVHFIACIADGF